MLRAKLLSKHQEYYFLLLLFFTVSAYIVTSYTQSKSLNRATQETPLSRNLSKAPKTGRDEEQAMTKQNGSFTKTDMQTNKNRGTALERSTEKQYWSAFIRADIIVSSQYRKKKKKNTGVPLSELTSLYHHSDLI